jgi:hypothetical protein
MIRPVFALALQGNAAYRRGGFFELVATELLTGLGEAFGDPALPIRAGLFLMSLPRRRGLLQRGDGDSSSPDERSGLNSKRSSRQPVGRKRRRAHQASGLSSRTNPH